MKPHETFTEGLGLRSGAEGALHHAHARIEVIDHGNENGFGRCSPGGGAPSGFALVTQHDMFESFEPIGIEMGHDASFADNGITEDNVTLQNALAGTAGAQSAFIFGHFPRVMDQDSGDDQVGVGFRVEW